ncbi:MAG: 4Fe-4S dicluster domain-containing protein [Campylobacterales bacterium]
MAQLSRRELLGRLTGQRPAAAPIALSTAACLAWNGTMCYACKEACNEGAIAFFGVFRPAIALEKCTRCGECVPVCPAGAIHLQKENP